MRGKKIISLILLLSLIMSFSTFQLVNAEEAETEAAPIFQEEMEFLKKIKVIDEDFDGSAKITKAELAKIIISVLHPDVDYSVPSKDAITIFNDVPTSHKYYSYIKACKDIKIINGDLEGNFYPDSTLTVMETVTIMCNALGYTLYADAMGGYPSGYYQIANQTGLLDGIKGDLSVETNGDLMAKVVYNALFADLSGVDSITDSGITIKLDEDKNLLAERLGIFEFDAIVYDNGISAMEGTTMGDTERVIIKELKTNDLYTAYVNGSDITSYLGYRVKVFIRNNTQMARNEVVYVTLNKKVKTLTIAADMIINANGDYVEYEENEDDLKAKKVKFGGVRPSLIFNGIRTVNKGLEEVIPNDGVLTFIDNNGDNNYDVVDVLSFNYKNGLYDQPARNIIVDTVLTINGQKYISCLLNPSNSLDLADEDISYAFTSASKKKSIYEISTYDVISIAEAPELVDGKVFYFLTVSDELVIGTLDGIVDGSKLEVNGNEYEVSSGLTSIKPRYVNNLVTGEEIYLCVDITGKVAYSVSTAVASKNYAYLISMRENQNPDKYLAVKMFTKEGEIKTYTVSSKVEIDGIPCKTVSSQMSALKARDDSSDKEIFDKSYARPVIFELNTNGEISKIDTDNPNVPATTRSDLYVTHTTIPYDAEEVNDSKALKAGYRGLRIIDYTRAGSVEGKFFITGETLIMAVPDIDTYGMQTNVNFAPGNATPLNATKGADQKVNEKAVKLLELPLEDENYKIFKQSDLIATHRYDIQGYDIDPDTGIAGLVVLRGRTDVISEIDESTKTNPLYIFLRTTEVYDAEAEKNVKRVYYTKDGKTELSATIDTDTCYFPYKYLIEGCDKDFTMYNTEVKPLHAGDIIRVITAEGKITHIDRVIAVAKDPKSYYGLTYLPSNATYLYTDAPVSKAVAETTVPGEDYGMPFDTVDYRYSTSANVTMMYVPVKKINGSTLQLMIPYTATRPSKTEPDLGEISTIKVDDPTTFNIYYTNVNGVITTVDISDDGKSVKVKNGSSSDIVTVDNTGNLEEASMVFIMSTYDKIDEMVIINNHNKIPVGEKWWVEE